jgi:hypothetical protein
MKGRKLFTAFFLVVLLVASTAACAKKAEYTSEAVMDRAPGEMPAEATSSQMKFEAAASEAEFNGMDQNTVATEEQEMPSGVLNNSSAITMEESVAVQTQDKIIRTFYMDVETQEFDKLITKLDAEINRLNGYVEQSRISGKSYYDNEGARYAAITARIPREKVDEFVSFVDTDENANVIDKQETTENVTLEYADIESRKKALEIEQERLFALLEKTDSLDSIVTLESRLSDIRYQLQNYNTTLLTYDNKVYYSTVTMNIQEVKAFTPVVEIKQSVGARIKYGLSNTIYRLSEGVKDFIVWFVINLPYLVIWAIILTAIGLIIRRIYRKNKKRWTQNQPTSPKPPVDMSN